MTGMKYKESATYYRKKKKLAGFKYNYHSLRSLEQSQKAHCAKK